MIYDSLYDEDVDLEVCSDPYVAVRGPRKRISWMCKHLYNYESSQLYPKLRHGNGHINVKITNHGL